MLEGSMMEYMKWTIIVISLFFISIVVLGMFKLNEVNSFQQEVNYQIERNGGLTDKAFDELNAFAQESYNSCVIPKIEGGTVPSDCKDPFRLEEFEEKEDGERTWSARGSNQAAFGTQIHYAIKREVGQLQGVPLFKPTVIGTSASRVRGSSN